ncbi:MAG: flavodoxin [Candidatus Desulfovibrio faecigallinarum]|nr:flavodoxin [Candidatus Desulfovibrio faecigallinarum]
MPLAGSDVLAAGKGDNVLVVYFSHSGNTRTIAEMIHQRVGGDIVEIETVKPYPDDYDACVEQAREEQRANVFPEISTVIPNMEKYRTVFLGYPNWWGTMPRAVFTFLTAYNMDDKTVAPFCTHGGSAMGTSESDIRKLCPKARILKGLPVRGRSVRGAGSTVDSWLQSIVF